MSGFSITEPSGQPIPGLATWPREHAASPGAHAPLVFCLPFAGGGTSSYRTWRRAVGDAARLCAIELPGHETANGQACLTEPEPLLAAVTACIAERAGGDPYVIYGHSFGGMLAYTVTPRLIALGCPPRRLVIGGCRPPGQPAIIPEPALYDDDALLADLSERLENPDPMRDLLAANPALRELFLPPLRADLALEGKLRSLPGAPLAVELLVLGGNRDPWTGAEVMRGWQAWAAAGYGHRTLDEGHFFTAALAQPPERLRALLLEPL